MIRHTAVDNSSTMEWRGFFGDVSLAMFEVSIICCDGFLAMRLLSRSHSILPDVLSTILFG